MGEPNIESEEKEPGRVEFSFPMLTIRTKIFSGVFDRLGALRISKWIGWAALVIVPIIAAIGLYLVSTSLFTLLWTPEARQITQELGPASYLLLPGINPILPIFYGWIAIVCAVVIHEGAHGIIARNRGFNVKSSGLLFFFIVPIGAFVDVDEEQIEKSKPKNSLRVMAGGVAGNTVVAVVCLIAMLLIVNGLTPVVNGVYISEVIEGMPAEQAGLMPADVFVSINGLPIEKYETDLKPIFADKNPGDIINVTVSRGKNWNETYSTIITLTESNGTAVMGITLGDLLTKERIDFYGTLTLDTLTLYMVPPSLAPGLVPFSDSLSSFYTHSLGSNWHVYANIFFWLWFVNLNVAIFNALPIYPLDGGRILDISLKSLLAQKASEKTISRITQAVTVALILILVMIAVIPFIL
ncbi:MAG: site-2 protease family protein [Candidatus Bathyarchaeum tardum]|nr:MAG: site-2 protease family protein [Candidatus Bathyarchaeum tardum]